jgi:DNA-binding transcriptional LysR family regulator
MNEVLIELRAWRQFVAVAEELHFGRAAALRLHMTQPPVTQAIAQLEKTLGVRAVRPHPSAACALTPAGEALLPDVRELLARAQALPARARAAAAGRGGPRALAFVSTVGFEQLPHGCASSACAAPRWRWNWSRPPATCSSKPSRAARSMPG